jgi:hypothetical protein
MTQAFVAAAAGGAGERQGMLETVGGVVKAASSTAQDIRTAPPLAGGPAEGADSTALGLS